jgi:hypothetical protein
MAFRGKSMMTGSQNTSKSLINPVSTNSQQELNFGQDFLKAINTIQSEYVHKMSSKKYLEIPLTISKYLSLNDTMVEAINKQKNTNLKLLFQIARDGMEGSMYSRTLFSENAELEIRVLTLTKTNDDIISGKNEKKAIGSTSGTINITKTFKLAPIYSYYIYLYGMPAYGVGFDAIKLSLLSTILTKYGIKPF